MTRSNRPDVRNPMLRLPAMKRLADLVARCDPEIQREARELLGEIVADSRALGEKCWRTHKPPMAAYWKAKAVDFRHLRAALNRYLKEGRSSQ